jgi:prepilin-type N-terminal cleavage/methylation domain-containing protein
MKNRIGFTIVELLIVIVVIGILAAISLVAYNGVQQKTKNAKTISAVEKYAKLLSMYKVDNGNHPSASSCIGVGYPGGRCRSDGNYVENGNNLNTSLLAPYLKNTPPSPDTTVTSNYYGDNTLTITGAFYNYNDPSYNSNGGGIGLIVIGGGNCPAITGLSIGSSSTAADGHRLCRYIVN